MLLAFSRQRPGVLLNILPRMTHTAKNDPVHYPVNNAEVGKPCCRHRSRRKPGHHSPLCQELLTTLCQDRVWNRNSPDANLSHNFMTLESATKAVRVGHRMVQVFMSFPMCGLKN